MKLMARIMVYGGKAKENQGGALAAKDQKE